MSPAAEEFSFQNPNPSLHKLHTDSGIFNNDSNNFNFMNLNKFDFGSSSDTATAAAVRLSKKRHVKVKKHSLGSRKDVNSKSNNVDFEYVFSASDSGSSLGQTSSNEFSVSRFDIGVNVGDDEVRLKSGGLDEKVDTRNASEMGDGKFGKVNGVDFVFGAKVNDGVDRFVKVDKFTNEAEAGSHLVDSMSGLNLGTRGLDEEEPMIDRSKVEENKMKDSRKFGNVDFVFSANLGDARTDMSNRKEESKEKIGKLDANMVFGAPMDVGMASEGFGKKDGRVSDTEKGSGDSAKRNLDSGVMFSNEKVNGAFHIGSRNGKRPGFKASRKVNGVKGNLKSEGVGSCDLLEKQDGNLDSVHDGNYGFVSGSNLGNAFGDTPQSKVSDETKTSNIHDPTKVNITNKINGSDGDLSSQFSNSFVFGSDKRKVAQETHEVNKVPVFEEKGKSDRGTKVTSFSRNETYLSSLTNGSGITNNFGSLSDAGGLETSFTGFNTPDINLATSFTSDMLSGLGMKLDFSKSKSVGLRKLKKKAKLRQKGMNCHQGGRTCVSKEVPHAFDKSSGCSPMDFSPYGGTECASTSPDPATFQANNEDAVDTTEKFNVKDVSSSSSTSFANVDVSARRRPQQKKYKLKIGRDLEFNAPKNRVDASHAYEFTRRGHTMASDQEICDKWRKRGNQAYKNGDLSEAEVCYSKGINSIQHSETPDFCTEPLLLCYSNRAAARMALGRLREGLKDCRVAAALDPNFVKVNLRSANCHLLLGELEEAIYYYNKCLESDIILDRRVAIEAADGLQKSQKVADHLRQSAELLKQKTYESATNALGFIADALSISCYSDKLLRMKGEALLLLGKHNEVVQMCEETLDLAEKNLATGDGHDCKNALKLWRWNLMSKSCFYLGRLEIALDLIEKHEQLRLTADKIVGTDESSLSLAVTIRELLFSKNAGNEAFQSGKHTEAVEHYTAAISKSMKSYAFAAVCFCNRAAALQSLGEVVDAIGDCSIAIALDGSYPKALSRRATLWEMIRDYKHAADDLQRLISILEVQSGGNLQKSATLGKTDGSAKDLRKARRRLSSVEAKAKKERPLDLYLLLGVKSSDSAVEVKKAYRKAALRHHPDKAGQVLARAESGSDGQHWKVISESIQLDADRLFKMIGEAYAVLSDSTKRSKYDLDEEMWEDMNRDVGSSSRRASESYSSPYDFTTRKSSHESRKTYSNSYYWENSGKTYHSSYPRW
uniref:uncharacterized protein LOC122594578 n=1 Tax=Erigeron canadensis TaxID=72917 RepID=UPI001CB8C89E|nr:uncharacterized protein LOC122594578 [Erigeron canadensis]